MQIDWVAIAAIAAAITVIGTIGGWFIAIGKLSSRVTSTEVRLEKTEKHAEALETALNEHKVAVAKEIVNRETIERMETKIFEAIDSIGRRFEAAINTIGQRIDSLVDRKTS